MSENNKEEIIAGIKTALKVAEKSLADAARYSSIDSVILERAHLVRQLHTAHHNLGYSSEWHPVK